MSLARRFMVSSEALFGPGQVEFACTGATPETYAFMVPASVTEMTGVAIAAGWEGANISPFPGSPAGNLHWNTFPVTPGEVLSVTVGTGSTRSEANKESRVTRGATYLLRAGLGSTLYHGDLGGGGGLGGAGGAGSNGNGGLGGGGPGYAGRGGRGGNYYNTSNGQLPETDSGGGRGGDSDGAPNGYTGLIGEGTGLLGRSADRTTSLGAKSYGAGAAWGGAGLPGAVRLVWGGGRAYPDNVPDMPSAEPATVVSASTGTGASPQAINVHGGSAQAGDLAFVAINAVTAASNAITGGDGNWKLTGVAYWKQLTAADIAASTGGTLHLTGPGNLNWTVVVYRGAVKVDLKSSVASTATTQMDLVGFTKRIDCKRVIVVGRDGEAGSGAIPTPAGFTLRGEKPSAPRHIVADAVPASYANGAAVNLTDIDPSGSESASLYELY